jgi:outer membrane protein OmpA-like peptidoglycan-associated protein
VKKFLPICLAILLTSSAWADSICRQATTVDFGPVVSSQSRTEFVITQNCEEAHLKALKPVQLSALIRQSESLPAASVMPSDSRWTVNFGLNSSSLDRTDLDLLNKIPHNIRVKVTGYTCSIGKDAYNEKLSRSRAEAVANYLQSRGVTLTTVIGKGECCPVSTTDLSKNRRVVIEEEK